MTRDTDTFAEVISVLGKHLNNDGRRRAAAELRDDALRKDTRSATDFLQSVASSLEQYADDLDAENVG